MVLGPSAHSGLLVWHPKASVFAWQIFSASHKVQEVASLTAASLPGVSATLR